MGVGVAARELGLVEQTLRNWAKAAAAGKLNAAGAKPMTPSRWSCRGYALTTRG